MFVVRKLVEIYLEPLNIIHSIPCVLVAKIQCKIEGVLINLPLYLRGSAWIFFKNCTMLDLKLVRFR